MASASTLILIRHGESVWNLANRFTGWTDVPLTDTGREEARRAGDRLREAGIVPVAAHVSVLRRAIETLDEVLERSGLTTLPIRSAWELNERHYGALQGLNKAEIEVQFGRERTLAWRRSFAVRPPLLAADDSRSPRFDPLYSGIPPDRLPLGESLQDTLHRVIPYWERAIAPDLGAGPVLVAAHGNSLRALAMHLERLEPDEIRGRNIPTGIPFVYRLDARLRVLDHRYLADAEELQAGIARAAHRP